VKHCINFEVKTTNEKDIITGTSTRSPLILVI